MIGEYYEGDQLVVSNDNNTIQFEIVESNAHKVKLLDRLTQVTSERNRSEIDSLVFSGKAKVVASSAQKRTISADNAIDFSSFPEEIKELVRDRYSIVNRILETNPKSLSAKVVEPILSMIFEQNEFKTLESKPHVRTVQRWLKDYIGSGYSIRALIPKIANRGNRNSKVSERVEAYIAEAINYFKKLEQPSIAKSYEYLETLIDFENRGLEGPKKLKLINKSAFIKRLEREAPKSLLQARKGKYAANLSFREKRQTQEIKYILQRVEADHTQLDLFIVDSEENLVLGRPYVTVLLDYKSKSIVGFYIGFEKPSYLSVAKALKHAIQPKDYVKEQYPEVINSYDCYGIMMTLVFDRGKDFESIALEDACAELNIRIQRNPGKHPWYKGSVESYFKSLNTRLLNDIPGKVFSNIVDTNQYDPRKHAVVTMSGFMEAFHVWVIDVYHQSKVSKGTIIPKVSWQEDIVSVPRRTSSKGFLDIVFSETETRKNTRDGIVFKHIYYDSEELLKLRQINGFNKVTIKYDREDLGYIYVLDDSDKRNKNFFKVPAVNQNYAKGLSLYQHEIINTFRRKYLDNLIDKEGLAQAKIKIQEIIERELLNNKAKAISSNQKIARIAGVGQSNNNSIKSSVFAAQEQISHDNYKGIPVDTEPHAKEKQPIDINSLPEPDYTKPVLPNSLKIKKRKKHESS